MILECKSCKKKFIVPDNAIPPSGRLVQCSSCGNKWTQFPQEKETKEKNKIISSKKVVEKKINFFSKKKKSSKKKIWTNNLFERISRTKTRDKNW